MYILENTEKNALTDIAGPDCEYNLVVEELCNPTTYRIAMIDLITLQTKNTMDIEKPTLVEAIEQYFLKIK